MSELSNGQQKALQQVLLNYANNDEATSYEVICAITSILHCDGEETLRDQFAMAAMIADAIAGALIARFRTCLRERLTLARLLNQKMERLSITRQQTLLWRPASEHTESHNILARYLRCDRNCRRLYGSYPEPRIHNILRRYGTLLCIYIVL